MLTNKETQAKTEVIIATQNWIVKELENTSALDNESILPEIILAFAKLINN